MCFSFQLTELAKDSLVNRMHCQVVEGIISPVNDSYATNKYLAPAHHRCEMIRRALKPLRGQAHWVRVDEWESQQSEWTRTLDVLKHFQAEVNRKWGIGEIKLRLLVGADLFETFNVPNLWKDSDIEEIITQYGLIVITRKGNDPWQTLKKSSKSSILTKHEVKFTEILFFFIKNVPHGGAKQQSHFVPQANIIIVEEKAKNGISSTLVR